jgi:hypothetical protein
LRSQLVQESRKRAARSSTVTCLPDAESHFQHVTLLMLAAAVASFALLTERSVRFFEINLISWHSFLQRSCDLPVVDARL